MSRVMRVMRRRSFIAIAAPCVFGFAAGCAGPEGGTPADKRRAVQQMRSDTLAKLYRVRPKARADIQRAAGYAVFSNVDVNVLLVAVGNGFGVAHDNKTGRDVYMKMASGGVGPGIGVKDFRAVFVFTTRKALNDFVANGWTADADADAAAKLDKRGGAVGGAADIAPGVKLYQLTENGLALQATIGGTKYWRDDELG
jgi:lipid-binding SYLF domain-containing protein